MESDGEVLSALRYGSKDEIGRAIKTISRLKDPGYSETLREIMNSDDPFLATMAAYALGEAGDKEGFQFLEKRLQNASGIFPYLNQAHDLKVLEEILRLPDTVNNAFDLYNSSYSIESKEKLLKLLKIYSSIPPKMNIPYFDDLVAASIKKTRGLLLDAIAICEFNLGNIENALEYSLEAVSIAQDVGDPQLLKTAYADLGHIHMSLGNYYSALELLHESLEIDESSHDPWRKKNRILSNLSQLYCTVGQYEKALEYIQEALELSEEENDINGRVRCLNTKGVILCNLNEFENAEECLQNALAVTRSELDNKTLQGIILSNMACVYFSLLEIEEAKKYLEAALALSVQMEDKSTEGNILASMAILELESDNIEEAMRNSEAALNIGIKICNPSIQADAYFILGTIEDYHNDNPDKAYEYYKESIALSENLRKNLMIDDFKISFAGNYMMVYQQMILLCIRMGRIEDAFEYIERSKSRAFVDMLSSTSDAISAKELSPEKLDEVAVLRGRLDLLRRQISASYANVNKDTSDIRLDDVKAEISDLERAYLRTFEDIKMKDPEWTSLVSIAVDDIASVQNRLDETTAILEFYQTGEDIVVLVIRKNKPPSVVKIPVDIEAESDRLFNLFMSLSSGREIDIRSHEFIKQIKNPLSYFHELLIAPIRELIADAEHLIIVPHNFWHYMPFHALYDNDARQYIVDRYSVSYAPSATALGLCCRESERDYIAAVIFANPSGDLPYAEDEGKVIRDKFKEADLFVREQATPDKLSEAGNADIVHLACHGYFRGDEPLFSHLVLAEAGGNKSPVFLPDIFNLRLKASIVTLSACETGLSQFTAGDELIGISRGFFYAGTQSLLSSLWAVNDKSTSLLMDRFYEGLVKGNKSKVTALKSAIQELKTMPEYSHPYFWAPFFLSGEWR